MASKNIVKQTSIKNFENTQIINKQSVINKNIDSKIENVSKSYFFKNINDFSTEWEKFETFGSQNEFYYKTWIIEWELFDLRLLPFLKIDFFYRRSGGNVADIDEYNLDRKNQSIVYIIGDITNETNKYYKSVKLRASISFRGNFNDFDYDGKLHVSLINPREYR